MDLVCTNCRGELQAQEGGLICRKCGSGFKIVDGIPVFLEEESVNFWSNWTVKWYSGPLEEVDDFCRFIKDWKTLLDLGCGNGPYSAPAAKIVERTYCVDPSLVALERLKARGISNLYPVSATGESLPFRDSFFDGVFLLWTIEHLQNVEQILKEIHRVLRPSGSFVVCTCNKYTYSIYSSIMRLLKRGPGPDPQDVHDFSPNELRGTLSRNGFLIDAVELYLPFNTPFPKNKLARFLLYPFASFFIIVATPDKGSDKIFL